MRAVLLLVVLVVGCKDPVEEGPVDSGYMDALPPSCMDGVRNGDESDLDCGGSCRACAAGETCAENRDCAEGTCFSGTCGDRMWFLESTGSNVVVPGTQTWTPAVGLSTEIQLLSQSLVFLRWTGTSRWAGGGNGLCALGQRFVIDGVPTGHASWGNAILVQNGATRWHHPFQVELAVLLDAGVHTIAAEMVNGGSYGTCHMDGDAGLDYDRSRFAIAAYAPTESWYAESTAGTGPHQGPSAWIDIPGVSLSIPLTDTRMVQFSLTGSQLAQAGTASHCAYRLVLDNAPLGDANHGQGIVVGDVATGWWGPVSVKYGVALNAGTHTVKAQMRNSGGATGSCDAGEANNPYSRFRLFAAANPVGLNQALESTGPSQYFASASAWTLLSGLETTLHTGSRPANVQIELAGTQRTVNGSGHCAYRLVVDGAPLGNASHGMMIDVGDATSSWWTYMGMTWGTKLAAGQHTIRVEGRNSSSVGDCGVNGDNLPYGRVRMLLRAL